MSTKELSRYKTSMSRVKSMLSVYEEVKGKTLSGDVRPTDVLRACVVFLHGAQEDYLRTSLTKWLPLKAAPEVFKDITLLGKDGRSQKYTLQDLLPLKDFDVDSVISKSVEQAMQQQTFNNYSEIVSWMRKIGIDLNGFKEQALIEDLTTRRHHIVHEVDIEVVGGSDGGQRLSHIELKTVRKWMDASQKLVNLIDSQIEEWDAPDNEDGASRA